MGQALYRKYRSRSLEELVGQEHITHTLARALKAGRVSHAYLFTGPRGVGKTSVARILAHEINQLPYSDAPNLDIIEIDAASNRRIDDIRDLREKVFITPIATKYKVYIIDEVHMLTGESFNALLKTLEEPPAHVVFILATTESHKLPATIISRAQRFAFRPVIRDKVVAHLRTIATKENVPITNEALSLIADHGEGSFRDSISLLDQIVHSSDTEITEDDVTAMLGLASKTHVQALVDAIISKDQAVIAQQLDVLNTQGTSTNTLVNQLNQALGETARTHPQLYDVVDNLLEVPRAYNPSLKLLTVLMRAAKQTPQKNENKSVAVRASTTTIATVKTPEKPAAKIETITSPNNKLLETFNDSQWQTVLTALKKASPPLYSVAKHAQYSFNTETQELLLTFKYQLHRKKLDDPKQRATLAAIIASTLGSSPIIKTHADTQTSQATSDPVVASVAAIMGGGEAIDAPNV